MNSMNTNEAIQLSLKDSHHPGGGTSQNFAQSTRFSATISPITIPTEDLANGVRIYNLGASDLDGVHYLDLEKGSNHENTKKEWIQKKHINCPIELRQFPQADEFYFPEVNVVRKYLRTLNANGVTTSDYLNYIVIQVFNDIIHSNDAMLNIIVLGFDIHVNWAIFVHYNAGASVESLVTAIQNHYRDIFAPLVSMQNVRIVVPSAANENELEVLSSNFQCVISLAPME